MKPKNKKNELRIAILGLGLSAFSLSCGGMPGASTPAAMVSAASTARGMIQSFKLGKTPTMSGLPGFGSVSLHEARVAKQAKALGGLSNDPCSSTKTPASSPDVDEDGIPVDQTYTFNCDNVGDGEGTLSLHGKYSFQDLDDTKKWSEGGWKGAWDYSFVFDTPASAEGGHTYPATKMDYSGKGGYSLTTTGATQNYLSDFSGKVAFVIDSKSGDYTYSGKWSIQVTPSATPSWKSGALVYKGQWTIQGFFPEGYGDDNGHEDHDGQVNTSITITSENLTYDADACSCYYKTGKVIYTDVSGHVFEDRYDCNSYKAFFDGEEYEAGEGNCQHQQQ